MKKVMFVTAVLVSLVFVGTCLGLESAPSNKVGYTKVDIVAGSPPSGTSKAFGLAFKFWDVVSNVPQYGVVSNKPSDIVGTQANPAGQNDADRIVRQGGNFAFRTAMATIVWTGLLETSVNDMQNAYAYWYINKSGVARTLVLAGEADTTGVGINARTITCPSTNTGQVSTGYSWRDPRVRPVAQLNLLGSPYGTKFLGGDQNGSDRVVEQGGSFAYYRTTSVPAAWVGLANVTPGKAYWIVNKHSVAEGGSSWSYTYLANGGPITLPPGDRDIDRVTVPKTSPVKTKTSAK